MLTLSDIARRNGLDVSHLRDLDSLGRLPGPVGCNSDGRLFDEQAVLAVARPHRGPESDLFNQTMGVLKAFAHVCGAKTNRGRLSRLAAGEFILKNRAREQNGETLESIADAARRLGIKRETFSRVVNELKIITQL